jgi:hypothetical protein
VLAATKNCTPAHTAVGVSRASRQRRGRACELSEENVLVITVKEAAASQAPEALNRLASEDGAGGCFAAPAQPSSDPDPRCASDPITAEIDWHWVVGTR